MEPPVSVPRAAGLMRAATEAATNSAALGRLQRLQDQVETQQAWTLENRISTIITRLDLSGEQAFESLSGGVKRRVLLGR